VVVRLSSGLAPTLMPTIIIRALTDENTFIAPDEDLLRLWCSLYLSLTGSQRLPHLY
jgi:hypothetical protein